MSSAKSQVAVATNIPNLSSSQQQKDYSTEEPLGRQNSFGLNRRGNMKGKHLTRSHAMREVASPPRTPTPRASESSSQMSPNGYQQQQQQQQHQQHMDINEGNNNNNSNNKLHTQSAAPRGSSPIVDTPTVIVTSQHKQQQQQQSNVVLCNEAEFPKLSPPKSKSGSNNGGAVGGVGSGSNQNCASVNNNCNNNQTRVNNGSEGHSNTNSSNNNSSNNNGNGSSKKANGDTAGANETHNKSTNNVNLNATNVNKNYNHSQQQQLTAGNALQKALNVSDSTQPTPIYNSPMNYQLHPNDVNRDQQQQQQQQSFVVYDKENRCPRNDSQNSMNSSDEIHYEVHQQQHPQHHQQHQSQQHHQRSGGGKKHRTNSNSKSSKPRLKNMGSVNNGGGGNALALGAGGGVVAGGITCNNMDGSLNSSNNTSGFISRENSNEQYTDHGGTDLLSFFKETLNKNVKDRQFLLKIEKDLIEFVQEGNRGEIRFPQASSYNRMLIHRTAAFFGMEHNVDTETQQCVIVAPTKNTRIPEIRFKTLVLNNRDDSRKSILKRDTHSFDEPRQSSYLCPERGGMLDRKAKSFEEREEDYDRARSRIFNRSQNDPCSVGGASTDDDNNYVSWTSSVEPQQFPRGRSSGKVLKIQNSGDNRSGVVSQKSGSFSNCSYGMSNQAGNTVIRGESANSNKSMGTGGGSGARIYSKQESTGSSNTSWRLSPSSSGDEPHLPDHLSVIIHRKINEDTASPILNGLVWAVTDISNVPKGSILINPNTLQPMLNADGTVYHYDPSSMPPAQTAASASVVPNAATNIYHTNQNNSPQQQLSVHNPIKKQHKAHQMQQQPQAQYNKLDSTSTGGTNNACESVAESSTQTVNVPEEVIAASNMVDVGYQEGDVCNQDENDECDNSVNGCLSITTTTSTKNYDRIEVQKFKNQATSPNIPNNEKDDIAKKEHSSQTPTNGSPTQQTVTPQSQTPQQSQTQNRETPHSSRSTPFSNSDTLTKRSSEESRATSWTQSYQAPDGSTVFHTTTTPNSSSTNPYCTTTYQQGPDGSIYAVPQGMIYAYPPPVEGEFQGYFMPVFDPSQQRSDTAGLLQPGTQAIYPATGATTMVPVAAYPTAQFTTTNGAPIYPSQVIYSGEQYQAAGAPLTATAPASATSQLQQIPMTTYPIGYPYPYNGYWGQTMTYYVPQQAVPATSLLAAAAPPASAPGNVNHVAGGANTAGPNGGSLAAGPSTNSSNTTINSGHTINGNAVHTSQQNSSVTAGYQTHVHTVGGSIGSSHSTGTTYYGTGRIKRPTPSHFNNVGTNGGHQVLTAASLPNGVTTATYQLGHAVPTLTLAAAAGPQAAAGAPATADLSGAGGAATTATMYALPQHATIFPANMFPYATNAAAPSIVQQSAAANMAPQATIIQTTGNPQGHITGSVSGQGNTTTGSMHNPHHTNTVITPFYTTTHHHAPHPGIQSSSHTIHAPGPSAIPIVDPATITNVTHLGPTNNSVTYIGRGGGGLNSAGTSQSAPTTPHSMPSSSNLHHSQRNTSVFSTPPIISNNGGNFNSSNSTSQYYGNSENSHPAAVNTGVANNCNSPHNSYVPSSYDKRNSTNSGGGKKPLSYQSASLTRQNSTSGGGYNNNGKSSALLSNVNNNNDTRASPSSSTNSRPHSIKRAGGGAANEKPQTPLLSGPPSFVGNANIQNANTNSYQNMGNADMGTGNIPIVNVSKPPIRLNASAAAFRQKGSTNVGSSNSVAEYRRNPGSQRNSPGTNASSNENSSNNSPNSIQNCSNAATPIATGCYAPSYMINAQNSGGEPTPTLPPSLYITTAPARGSTHIPPHLQSAAANGLAVPAAAAAAAASVPPQTATAVLGGAAAAAAAADVANAAAVAAAAATVAHHHHHQPLLGTYNPGASGLYFKYGHTYFAHPSVALPNSRRSPSTDLRPPIAQMAGMYPTVNMMIPAPPRHPGRHPNPNYKGTRPR